MVIPIIEGLARLAPAYDAFILDIWGVVHQGGSAYPEALDCIAALRRADKRVAFLSNAPRRADRVAAVLREKGVPDAHYDAVVSSGEAARLALASRRRPPLDDLGGAYYLLGPAADGDLLQGLDYRGVASVGEADFLLAIGLEGPRASLGHYEPVLREAAARALPMVCVNPDRLVIRLGVRELCAGALAARYAELGGPVDYVGKPYPEVYALCLERLGVGDRRRVLAVGDGLETDIRGAQAAGIDSLLVTGGLLADALGIDRKTPPEKEALEAACARAAAQPTAAIATLVW